MASPSTRRRVARVQATVIDGTGERRRSERLAGEEPLEIRVAVPGGEVVATTATMRTPGQDFALAAGLLHAEGVIAHPDDVAVIRYCADVEEQNFNVVTVELRRQPRRTLAPHTIGSTASCGVCGTATIDDLCDWVAPLGDADADGLPLDGPALGSGGAHHRALSTNPRPGPFRVDAALLASLPDRLRAEQPVFDETGGLHAAGLFDADGRALVVHEDVGRHNALDKVLGDRFLSGGLPASEAVVVLSGRVSFELVQKTAAAGVPVICAVSAPSSLAVETARRLGLTLAAFVRNGRLTVYAGAHRITTDDR